MKNLFIKLALIFTLLFTTNLLSSQENADSIGLLTANSLYNFDYKALPTILRLYLKEAKDIKALILSDSISNDVAMSYYLEDNKQIFNKQIPEQYKSFKTTTSNVLYQNEVVGVITLYYTDDFAINLTDKEEQWLSNHPIIKVSNENDWAPFDFAVDGEATGYSIDLIKLLAQKIGIKLDFINGYSWSELVQRFDDGKIDMMHVFNKTPERLKKYIYSNPYMKSKYAYITKKDNNSINSPKDFDGKKIASGKGWASTKVLKQKYPKAIIVEYETTLEVLNAVSFGKVDIAVEDSSSASYTIIKNFITNLKLIGQLNLTQKDTDSNFYFASSKNSPELITMFNKALESLSTKEKTVLKEKWFGLDSSDKLNLSNDEKKWLKNNTTIKLAVMNYWPHDSLGNSFHTEMLKLINKYTGTNIIPAKYEAWSDGFELAKSGIDLHGIMGLSYSKEREEKYFDYSPAYNFTASYVITRNDNRDIKNIKDLENKTIYLKSKSISHKIIEDNVKNVNIINLSTMDEMYKNLSTSKKVDAFVSYFADIEKLDKYNLKIVQTMYERYGEVSIGISHKYPHLTSIIKKAFDIIPSTEIAVLRDKRWTASTKNTVLSFTQTQQNYLKEKKVLKICTNPNWAPIEFVEEGINKGISIDILNILQDKLDIKYEYIKTTSWKQSQEFLKDKKCDILPSAIKTAKREKFANFTAAYLNYDLAIITKNDQQLTQDMESLLSKSMSRKEGSELISKVKKIYPTITIKETKSTKVSFDAVLNDDVYFTIATIPVLQYYKSKYGLKDLQISGYTKMKYDIRMAVRNDEKVLLDILNIALDGISKQTYKIIHDKWASVKVVQKTNWTLILQITGVVILVLLFLLLNNRKLKTMVAEKTKDIAKQKDELELILSSFDKNVIFSRTDLKGNITHVSDAFCKISGYSFDELIGKPHNIVRHPDMPKEAFKEIWYALQHEACIKVEVKNLKKDGSSYWVESKFEPDYDTNDKVIGYSALRVDITSKQEVKKLSNNLEITVERRTKELSDERKFIDSVMNSQSSIVITTDGDHLRSVNKAFLEFYNVKNQEEFINNYGECICDTFDNNTTQEYIKKEMDGITWIDYISRNINEQYKTIIIKDNKKYTFSISMDTFLFNDRSLNTVVFNDITELENVRKDIESLHKHTRESIEYASMIQGALLPNETLMSNYFKDYFVSWIPKDTVGGDIWLFNELRHNGECLLFFIDCTGHGVPGAFVTMIVKAIEREIITKIIDDKDMDVSPAWIMQYFNQTMKTLLKQETQDSQSNAGWDGGIIYYNKKDKILKFAGAETPLYYMDIDGELKTIKGDRYSVGYKKCAMDYEYKETILEVKEGMNFYCTTDGYLDQNGGEKGFPFGKRRFKSIIENNYQKPMNEQKEVFKKEMKNYEKMVENNDRNDDITLVAFKI